MYFVLHSKCAGKTTFCHALNYRIHTHDKAISYPLGANSFRKVYKLLYDTNTKWGVPLHTVKLLVQSVPENTPSIRTL